MTFHPITPPSSQSPPSSPERKANVKQRTSARRRIRSVLMRAGTSKGLFFRLDDLPTERAQWQEIITAAMGSPDQFGKQLNGVGGGVSTQSKVAVVSRSEDPRADVDYLFIQVPIQGGPLDFSGNCGNMSSGVGPFAVDEGLFRDNNAGLHNVTVRIRNVNTNRIIHSTFAVENASPLEAGPMMLDGVGSSGAPIRLDFLDPAGSMTGRLLPTGNATDEIRFGGHTFTVSMVDASNPFVFVHRDQLGLDGGENVAEITARCTDILMEIRAHASILMGLAASLEQARAVMGTPKIAIVGAPCEYTTSSGRLMSTSNHDIYIRAYSMGKPHPAIQMTGAVCVASAASVPGTLVHMIASSSRADATKPLIIGHSSGSIATDSIVGMTPQGEVEIRSGSVYRTARRLMEGSVCI